MFLIRSSGYIYIYICTFLSQNHGGAKSRCLCAAAIIFATSSRHLINNAAAQNLLCVFDVCIEIYREKDREKDREKNRQKDRETDRQTENLVDCAKNLVDCAKNLVDCAKNLVDCAKNW